MYAALKQQSDIRQWLRGMGLTWRRTVFRCYLAWWEMVKDIPASRRSAFDFHSLKEDIDAAAIEQPEPEPAACPDTPDEPEPQPVACPDTSEGVEEVVVQISFAMRAKSRRR